MADVFDERTIRILRHARDLLGGGQAVMRTFAGCGMPLRIPCDVAPRHPSWIDIAIPDATGTAAPVA
jgi:hypothetical protein